MIGDGIISSEILTTCTVTYSVKSATNGTFSANASLFDFSSPTDPGGILLLQRLRRQILPQEDFYAAPKRAFWCETCGNSYKYERGLKRHRLECGQEKRLSCLFCSHKAHRRDNLNMHMLLRHGFSITKPAGSNRTDN
ncbi:unnamed protein product [Phyllotreta striolata]|uniref:C2H2-type domain-containing protein n=1 Tax=Phyllotreta striolata TaxID=444603 RepID=A0A9N9U183_PHYSR|nr:unnamed protein product [Phyllotreta striolata]